MATTTATTTVAPAHPVEEGPFYKDAEFWVAVGFLILIGFLIYKKVHVAAFGALDARSAKIRSDLDEAARLRSEAETLLERAATRFGQAEADAARIVEQAVKAGEALAETAARDLEAAIARRTKSATDRIASAQRAAEISLRDHAVDLATGAARRIIAADTGAAEQTRLTDAAIGELDRRLH